MCQHSDTAQCKVIGNSNMTHTKCCYFNVSLYLTSPLLTARQSTFSPTCNSNMYRKGCHNRPTLPVGTISLMVISSTPLPLLSAGLIAKMALFGPQFRFASLSQEKFLLSLLDIILSSLSFPASSLVTILTELSGLPSAPRT